MEIWKTIEGYNGRYQVSNLGRVRSVDAIINNCTRKGVLLKQGTSKKGYKKVRLSQKNKTKTELVHRLVACSFVSGYKPGYQVNHKNEIKNDNRAENLEWCSCKYNCNYGTRRDRISIKQKICVIQKNKNGDVLKVFLGLNEAARISNINAAHICDVCKGKRKTAGGFTWEYK